MYGDGSLQSVTRSNAIADVEMRGLLRQVFAAAVESANSATKVAAHLPPRPNGRCVVVGAGKAAAAMASAVEAAWPDIDLTGIVVVPYGYAVPNRRIEILEAGHPMPDANSEIAGRRMFELVAGLSPEDLVLALFSGGGSSTLCVPAPGLTLANKQVITRLLLSSGLDIRVINEVRRRISAIKGGKLASAAAPAQVFTLCVSDIPGDDATAIASGPTLVSPNPSLDLAAIVDRLGADLPPVVTDLLKAGAAIATPSPQTAYRIVATPGEALAAAAHAAERAGIPTLILGDSIEGEARTVGEDMARLTLAQRQRPLLLLSGGETTVTMTEGKGRGGRNTEFLLSLAIALDGAPIWALAADTDGLDGTNPIAAGAILNPTTLSRARGLGLDPQQYLAEHNSGEFFALLDDLVVTGPTFTNVNDFRAILIG